MNKYETIDKYILSRMKELEIENENTKTALESANEQITELEGKLSKLLCDKIEIEYKTEVYYNVKVLNSYNFKEITNKELLKIDFLQNCLKDDEALNEFIEKAERQSNYYENKFFVEERAYNARIDIFSTPIVLEIVNIYNELPRLLHATIDNKQYFLDKDLAHEGLLTATRQEIRGYLKYYCPKEEKE